MDNKTAINLLREALALPYKTLSLEVKWVGGYQWTPARDSFEWEHFLNLVARYGDRRSIAEFSQYHELRSFKVDGKLVSVPS
tara:strand:- start:2309 stop:2554 length:246 start_codon:yes stop_codon:yes gene_type:complete